MATYWENSCSFGLRYVSWYKYLIVSLVFSRLGIWSGSVSLIARFPDLCLLVLFFLQILSRSISDHHLMLNYGVVQLHSSYPYLISMVQKSQIKKLHFIEHHNTCAINLKKRL